MTLEISHKTEYWETVHDTPALSHVVPHALIAGVHPLDSRDATPVTFPPPLHSPFCPRGVFRGGRGGRGPPIEIFLAPFKYSLTWFLPNHVYNLCRIA